MLTDFPTRSPGGPRTRAPSLVDVVAAATGEYSAAAPRSLRHAGGYCNDLVELELSGGRVVIVKRARYAWSAPRLRTSRLAARLIRRRTGVIVPRHLDVEEDADGRAVEAYWRIPLPTLGEVWPELPDPVRPQALRSWGALLGRVHKVKLVGHGALDGAARISVRLSEHIQRELLDRLGPALAGDWPVALPWAKRLARCARVLDACCAERPVVLVHNDFHMGNVLCERRPRSVRCVGVIDLETAWAGPPEADVAQVQVLHGPAFGDPLPPGWEAHFLRGYGTALDSLVLTFFRAYHLLNLGYFSATAGWWEHVRGIEGEIGREMRQLRNAGLGGPAWQPRNNRLGAPGWK
jgi:aminoglycoside phosphotransferase (APT) family kinase protein